MPGEKHLRHGLWVNVLVDKHFQKFIAHYVFQIDFVGQDDEELFEHAMHPAQYEAEKSCKAKEDFLEDVAKRRAEKDKSPEEDAKPKTI